MLQKISGHLIRVVAGTVALFVAHMNPLVYIPRQSIPIHARIVNDSGGMGTVDCVQMIVKSSIYTILISFTAGMML